MYPVAGNEAERLEAIRSLGLSATVPDPRFDAVCRTAAALFKAPIALISIVEADEQWFRGKCGLTVDGTPRSVSFCAHAIMNDAVFVVEDASRDPRFSGNPLVIGPPGIRFYAGIPLALDPGLPVGSLCLIDTVPRSFGEAERAQLQDLALIVVSQLRQTKIEADLRDSEAHYRLLADNTNDMIVLSGLDTIRRYVSPAARTLLGYDPAELLGTRPIDGVHPEDAPAYQRILDDIRYARVQTAVSRQRYLRKDGTWTWVEVTFNLTHDPMSRVPHGYVAAVRDVNERMEAERRIAHMAQHDALTDLANRTLFEERLSQEIARSERHGDQFAVFYLDLDCFKAVNDTLGHQAGDAVLRIVSARMRAIVRTEDTIARFGGDEFMVLQTRTNPAASHALARRFIQAVCQPMEIDGARVGIGVSIGITFGPQTAIDGDGLHRQADIALYEAKAGGRNAYRIYASQADSAIAPGRRAIGA